MSLGAFSTSPFPRGCPCVSAYGPHGPGDLRQLVWSDSPLGEGIVVNLFIGSGSTILLKPNAKQPQVVKWEA